MKDAAQVLDIMRDALLHGMDDPQAVDEFRIQRAMFVGKSGRLIGDNQITGGNDVAAGLRLTMRSGDEYDLSLT